MYPASQRLAVISESPVSAGPGGVDTSEVKSVAKGEAAEPALSQLLAGLQQADSIQPHRCAAVGGGGDRQIGGRTFPKNKG